MIETDYESIHKLVDKLDDYLEEVSKSLPYNLLVAGGLSKYDPNANNDIEQLIKTADQRMYRCKEKLKRKSNV